MDLPTLRFRRLKGDMIETYKLLSGMYDPTVSNIFTQVQDGITRGHSKKLMKLRTNSTLRAHFFTHRITNDWNALPDHVVTAPSLNAFKNRLDTHWKHHPWMRDWEADLGPLTHHTYRPHEL